MLLPMVLTSNPPESSQNWLGYRFFVDARVFNKVTFNDVLIEF